MTRNELIARVKDINGIYKWATGKSLSEVDTNGINIEDAGALTGMTDAELSAIVDEFGAAADAAKYASAEYAKTNQIPLQDMRQAGVSGSIKLAERAKQIDTDTRNAALSAFNNTRVGIKQGTLDKSGKPITQAPQAFTNNRPVSSSMTDQTGGKPFNIEDLVNTKFAPAYDNLERILRGSASQRGGLDTGGYQTSLAKGTAELDAAKAGANIDWAQFLKSLELPTQQFEWQKNVQFPESVNQFNKSFGLQNKQFNYGVGQDAKQLSAMNDYYNSQPKANWYDPLVSMAGYALAGPVGGGVASLYNSLFGTKKQG